MNRIVVITALAAAAAFTGCGGSSAGSATTVDTAGSTTVATTAAETGSSVPDSTTGTAAGTGGSFDRDAAAAAAMLIEPTLSDETLQLTVDVAQQTCQAEDLIFAQLYQTYASDTGLEVMRDAVAAGCPDRVAALPDPAATTAPAASPDTPVDPNANSDAAAVRAFVVASNPQWSEQDIVSFLERTEAFCGLDDTVFAASWAELAVVLDGANLEFAQGMIRAGCPDRIPADG